MFKGKTGYYLILVLCMAGAFWLGYFITQLIRGHPLDSTDIACAIVAAVVVGLGVVFFSMKHRHGEQEIPCNIQDTQNVKVNNYHFIMATSKANRGMASVKSTDYVNGIAVEPLNKDAQPHRIKIEVRLNKQSDQIASHDMVINAGAAVPVTLPFPQRFRLADISSVDIRIRQV
ncbi:MAG: hypothetical protein WC455_05220 [Dehalococcoidia bacterium]|jgi:hypothetical protein